MKKIAWPCLMAVSLSWVACGGGGNGSGFLGDPSPTAYSCLISCASGSNLLELCSDYGAISQSAAKEQCRKETCGSGMHVQGSNSVVPRTCAYKPCGEGRADCDGDPSNGCEAELSNDANNCGVCGNVCAQPMGTTFGESACVMGTCKLGCPDLEACCARQVGTQQQDCYAVARQGSSTLCYQWRQYICTPVAGGPVGPTTGTGGVSGTMGPPATVPSISATGGARPQTIPVVGGTPVAPVGGAIALGGAVALPPVLGGTTATLSVVGGSVSTLPIPPIAGAVSKGGTTVSGGISSGGAAGATTGPVAGGGSVGGAVAVGGTTGAPLGPGVARFNNGQAVGAINGYAWVAPSPAATLSDPLCGGRRITSTQTCSGVPSWNPANALCISAFIPAVAQSSDYTNNWGLALGVNTGVDSPMTGTQGVLGHAYKSVTFKVAGTPLTGLMASIQKQGDYQSYLAKLTPGVPIPFTQFATDYYQTTPKGYFFAADVPKIASIGIQVISGNQEITVSNLCWEELVLTE